MTSLRTIFSAFAFLATSTAVSAQAVDLNDAPEIKVYTFNIGWYGRVYAGFVKPDFDLSYLQSSAAIGPLSWEKKGSGDDSWVVGLAAGYRFNDLLRFDVSYDYHGANDFNKRDSSPLPSSQREYDGKISSHVLMVNGFVDFGTFKGMTPYIGIGIGAASNHITDASINSGGYQYKLGSHNEWNLAWALHTGIGLQLTEKATFELGYSYMDLGDAKSGTSTDGAGHFEVKDLRSHNIKVGLRYAFR